MTIKVIHQFVDVQLGEVWTSRLPLGRYKILGKPTLDVDESGDTTTLLYRYAVCKINEGEEISGTESQGQEDLLHRDG